VEVTRLYPTTGGTETVCEDFVPQSRREAPGPQPLFKHRGFRKLLRSGFRLLLCPQQLGFQEKAGFLRCIGDNAVTDKDGVVASDEEERRAGTDPLDKLSFPTAAPGGAPPPPSGQPAARQSPTTRPTRGRPVTSRLD
jgi:hypothetical protein